MRIAAIYIEKHEYLFDSPQTINFGTKYFYSFTKDNEDINVVRTINDNYIDGFFDLTKLDSKLTNINAIVGQNGAGKSTLLDIIKSEFIEQKYALPQTNSLFLIEIDELDEPIVLRNDFEKIFLLKSKTEKIELKHPLKNRLRTIYYSPHYDYKYNPNFQNIDNHDISFDKIVEQDLSELREKETNDAGWHFSATQELIYKNSLRQITFLSSDLIKKHNIFKDIFQLQNHYKPILIFRGYNSVEKEWNTPFALRSILKLISEKLEKEISKWTSIRKLDKDENHLNQVEINQYILKRRIIQCIISLLYRQMERKNSYLSEAHFPERYKNKLGTLDAYEAFLLFAEHSEINFHSRSEKIFSADILKNLLVKLYDVVEKTTSEDSVKNSELKTSTEDAIEILNLQRQFLNELNVYYYKFYSKKKELLIDDKDKIEEFINYMPFERRMSSGENSLLNFYSRVYGFLNSNLKEVKSRELKDHYILLLDEADLSFHLAWKKKYVKALLKTLPYFFNELDNKPSIEIIFTTHDPITLSDLPNTNVIYVERQDYESPSKILEHGNKNRPLKTFGANISDLIADSFFIENSFIGDFAFDKIHSTIEWLNKKGNRQDADYHKKLINMIDEPIVQRKLAEMYDDKMQDNFQKLIIENQIKRLTELKEKL